MCINTEGSYNCFCKPGYSGDGQVCTGEVLFSFVTLETRENWGFSSRNGLWDFYSGQAKDENLYSNSDLETELTQICFRLWLFYFLLLQRDDKTQQVDETKPCRCPVKLFT